MTKKEEMFNSPEYFEYWLTGFVSTCELIAGDAFRQAWVLGDGSVTSIYSASELFEQVLGDLHLEESIAGFHSKLQSLGALEAIATVANELIRIEGVTKSAPQFEDPGVLLSSQEWISLQATAKRLVELPSVRKYRQEKRAV